MSEPDIRTIYNYPVVPENSDGQLPGPPPMTRADFGADFRNALYFSRLHSPTARQLFHDVPLASAAWTNWYGNVEIEDAKHDPDLKGKTIDGWQEIFVSHAEHGVYVMFNSLCDSDISKAEHDRMRDILGTRFIGYDEGEWDGAYACMAAGKCSLRLMDPLPPDRSRREACRHYFEWMNECYTRHHHYMATTSSLLFGCHYAAELGSRMLGLELGERLPSDTLMLAFCRGACKQYERLMMTYPSVYSVRGIKVYPRKGLPQSFVTKDGLVCGPNHGTTVGLLKRLWWCSYMSGASLIGIQSGHFYSDVGAGNIRAMHDLRPFKEPVTETSVKAELTPLGRMFLESRDAALAHPVRGVPYTPIAVMLHHDHGWYPHPNFYTDDQVDCVWGNVPYNAGDRQTERFFDWVYPDYRLAATHHDERGKIVNTPFGDSFDVILSNASSKCLAKYQCIVLLGSWDVESTEDLTERLAAFVHAGGTVIADSSQWPSQATRGTASAVAVQTCGRGELVVVDEPAWGADRKIPGDFEAVTHALAPRIRSFELIEREGPPVYYAVNVTDRPDEILLTLCNNSHTTAWDGSFRVKGQRVDKVDEWLSDGETRVANGALHCVVPANDVRVMRIQTVDLFLPLRFEHVPWRDLGYGAPETSS